VARHHSPDGFLQFATVHPGVSESLDRVDCLQFPGDPEGTVRLVPAGTGERIVAAHREEEQRRNRVGLVAAAVLALAAAAVALVVLGVTATSVAGSVGLLVAMLYAARRAGRSEGARAPELVSAGLPAEAARERYTVAAASATPFGGELSD
jgi:hypothetical protein